MGWPGDWDARLRPEGLVAKCAILRSNTHHAHP